MKKILILCLFAYASMAVSAQTMRELWISMPDSLALYLNKSLRTELADYVNMKATPVVKNLLEDTTRVEKLTSDYMAVSLTPSSRLEIKALDKNTIAVVKTWLGPAADSKLYLFDRTWKPKPFRVDTKLQTVKPDSLSEADYTDEKLLLDPYFVKFTLPENNATLSVDYSFPMLNKADSQKVKNIVRKRLYKWDGTNFIE